MNQENLQFGSSSKPICLLMDERDLRKFLSEGFVGRPHDYPHEDIWMHVGHPGNGWSQIESNENIISEGTKPCLVHFDRDSDAKDGLIQEVLPASSITHVLFADDAARDDFQARNSVFSGITTDHFQCDVEPDLQFQVAPVDTEPTESKALHEFSKNSAIEESDRAVGAVSGTLASHQSSPAVLRLIEQDPSCSRSVVVKCLVEVCRGSEGQEGTLEFVLDLLADPANSSGFDPMKLLETLQQGLLSQGLDDNSLTAWADCCREILENKTIADPALTLDGPDILLRSLLLLLRTKPLDVHSIEQWSETSSPPGHRVQTCSLLLSGWYQGFSKLHKAKTIPALFRYSCRALAAGIAKDPAGVPSLELEKAVQDSGSQVFTLRESGEEITVTVIEPDPGLMEAWYATKRVIKEFGDEFHSELNIEDKCFEIRGKTAVVVASLEKTGLLRWCAEWTWKDRGRQRKWQPRQYEQIAQLSRRSLCAVYPIEFPRCGLHVYQGVATMDHDEVRFQVEGIIEALKGLEKLGPSMV